MAALDIIAKINHIDDYVAEMSGQPVSGSETASKVANSNTIVAAREDEAILADEEPNDADDDGDEI